MENEQDDERRAYEPLPTETVRDAPDWREVVLIVVLTAIGAAVYLLGGFR